MSASSAHSREEALAQLLLDWEDRREAGQDVSPEVLCCDRLDLVEPLRQKIAALKALSPLISTRLSIPNTPRVRVAESVKMPSIPGYEVLGELGRGGMGIVFKARHLALKRLVALKTIRTPGQASTEQLSRFRVEAEAVARLQHPHIVQIYDVGEYEGTPYFALEFVAGGTLDRRLDGKPIAPRLAAECLEVLAGAIHFAHEHGIVHRDLKPGNILLDESKREGAADKSEGVRIAPSLAKIADFGLAKFFSETESGQTSTGAILGTPSYMAPEQASGQSREIGPATDVYALGAILYELLTGRPPFRAETAWDTIAQVIAQEPIPPSRFQPKLPRDLETICLRCLQKKPGGRYSSAQAMGEDLRRYLDGMAILAKPPSPAQRLSKWIRRRPALAALVAAIVIGAVSLLVLGILWTVDVQDANDKIRQERDLAKKAEAKEREQHVKARRSLYDLQLAFVKMVHEKEPSRGLALLDDKERCPEELRDFSWRMFRKLCKRDRIVTTLAKDAKAVAFLKSGDALVAADTEGSVQLLDLPKEASPTRKPLAERLHYLAASPGGDVLYGASGEGEIYRVDNLKTGQRLLLGKLASVAALQVSADGSKLVTATRDGEVVAFHLPGGERMPVAKGLGVIAGLALPQDGKFVAVACDAHVRLFDLVSGTERQGLTVRKGPLTAVALSPDGHRLAACTADGVIQWWDTGNMQPLGRFDAMRTIPVTLAMAPNGRSVAVGTMDGIIRQIDLETQQESLVFTGHAGAVWRLEYSPDGRTIASAGADRTVRLWALDPPVRGQSMECKSHCLSAAFSTDGNLFVGARNGRISRWDVPSATLMSNIDTKCGPVTCLRVLAQGFVASGHARGILSLRALDGSEQSVRADAHAGPILSLAAAPSGDRLLTAGQDGFVRCWQCPGLKELWNKPFGDVLWSIDEAPGGDGFAVGGSKGQVWLCSNDGSVQFELPKRKGGVFAVAYSPDGKTLAVGGLDHAIEIWDLPNRTRLQALTGPRVSIRSIAFPPDGRTLASIADDGEVRLWDLLTGQERLRLPLPTLAGNGVVFSPDGRALAAFTDTKAIVWQP